MPAQRRADRAPTLASHAPRAFFAVLALAGFGFCAATGAAVAAPVCGEARGKLAEATALREQARQEAYAGSRDRVCDTLDEATDRTEDARDILEECGRPVVAIDLRTELRDLRDLKRFNRCG